MRKFHLPDAPDPQAYSPNLDYQDVKLKIVQQEGYDAHDFNLFDDRSSQLWRKPYVDGAVRELTSGDSRSQEQIRQAVEQMMIASGTTKPDVRHTSRKAHRERANVTVEVDIDDEQDLLTDIRRHRKTRSLPAGAHKISRARARTGPAPPPVLVARYLAKQNRNGAWAGSLREPWQRCTGKEKPWEVFGVG